MMTGIRARLCLNEECNLHRKTKQGNIPPHGWYKTKREGRTTWLLLVLLLLNLRYVAERKSAA